MRWYLIVGAVGFLVGIALIALCQWMQRLWPG